jgi:hypothetical protein
MSQGVGQVQTPVPQKKPKKQFPRKEKSFVTLCREQYLRKLLKPDVVHVYNSSMQETEAGGSQVPSQPRQLSKGAGDVAQ